MSLVLLYTVKKMDLLEVQNLYLKLHGVARVGHD